MSRLRMMVPLFCLAAVALWMVTLEGERAQLELDVARAQAARSALMAEACCAPAASRVVLASWPGPAMALPLGQAGDVADAGLPGYPDSLPHLERDGVVSVLGGAWDAGAGGRWGELLAILVAAAVVVLRQLAVRVPVLGHRLVVAAQVFLLAGILHLVGWSRESPLTWELVGAALRTGVEAAGGFSLLKALFETFARDFGWGWAQVVLNFLSPPRPAPEGP
jgi:hypothetical protein